MQGVMCEVDGLVIMTGYQTINLHLYLYNGLCEPVNPLDRNFIEAEIQCCLHSITSKINCLNFVEYLLSSKVLRCHHLKCMILKFPGKGARPPPPLTKEPAVQAMGTVNNSIAVNLSPNCSGSAPVKIVCFFSPQNAPNSV